MGIIKDGDRVVYRVNDLTFKILNWQHTVDTLPSNATVISIKRPSYEVVFSLLNDVEKDYLKTVIKPFKSSISYTFKDSWESTENNAINFVLKDHTIVKIAMGRVLNNLQYYTKYSLEDLGL